MDSKYGLQVSFQSFWISMLTQSGPEVTWPEVINTIFMKTGSRAENVKIVAKTTTILAETQSVPHFKPSAEAVLNQIILKPYACPKAKQKAEVCVIRT